MGLTGSSDRRRSDRCIEGQCVAIAARKPLRGTALGLNCETPSYGNADERGCSKVRSARPSLWP